MNLSKEGRQYYSAVVTTTPAVPDGSTWQASFDGGVTWLDGEDDPDTVGATRWLVAGPDAAADGATVISAYTVPLFGCTVGEEFIVTKATTAITLF